MMWMNSNPIGCRAIRKLLWFKRVFMNFYEFRKQNTEQLGPKLNTISSFSLSNFRGGRFLKAIA